MKKLLLVIALLPMLSALSQAYSKHDADSLLAVLDKSISRSGRMHALTALAEYQVLKPGEFKSDFDSAADYLSEAQSINDQEKSREANGYILYVRSMIAKESGHRETGKELVKQAIKVLQNGKNKSYFGRANFELATYYDYNNREQLAEMITLVEVAGEAYRQTDNVERYAYSQEFLGDLYFNQDNYVKSKDALDRSLAAYKSINHQKLFGVYVLYAAVYYYTKNNRQALKYNLLAMKNAESMGDTSMQLCQIYNSVGNLYVGLSDTESALTYYNKALNIALRHQDTSAVGLLVSNMVLQQVTLKRFKEAEEAMNGPARDYLSRRFHPEYADILLTKFYFNTKIGQYELARLYASEFIQLSKKLVIRESIMYNFYTSMIYYLFATKEYAKIDSYLSKMENLPHGSTASTRELHRLKFRRDTALNNYPSAVANLLTYVRLGDSLFNETSSRQQKQMEVEYETMKKEDSIQLKNKDILLLTQQNKLQEVSRRQDKVYRNIAIASGAFLAIILLLVYRQYRQKQKNNILINKKNEQLQHFLTEKEWLLKEIHHRVKNNLQIVMSLLNSQSAYIDSAPARNAIYDSQRRVHAMSLIHQKLYGSEKFSSISLPVYIRELGTYLAESFDLGQRIHLEYDIAPIEVDVSQAVPLGLILNEAITNSIKYAFPGEMRGAIAISLLNTANREYLLSVSDNGIGIKGGSRKDSLGMSLMQGLSEDLNGSFSIESNNGTTIKIIFEYQNVVNRRLVLDTPFASSN